MDDEKEITVADILDRKCPQYLKAQNKLRRKERIKILVGEARENARRLVLPLSFEKFSQLVDAVKRRVPDEAIATLVGESVSPRTAEAIRALIRRGEYVPKLPTVGDQSNAN